MSFPVNRVDQLCIVISEPIQHVKHYTIVEIRGVLVNFSSEELYVVGISSGGIAGKVSKSMPSVMPAHSATGEILLLTIEVNRDEFDPIENMVIGNIRLQYSGASGAMYLTAPALFQLILS
jgi:hypothetical protein